MPRVLFTFHSALLSVGYMEHSDSESDFELQQVDPGLDGLFDEPRHLQRNKTLGDIFCSCGPCLCCSFKHKKVDETDFILQVTLAVLKSVPSMCSCTVCLGGSGG